MSQKKKKCAYRYTFSRPEKKDVDHEYYFLWSFSMKTAALMPMLAAYQNFFSLFLISTYVGFVPVSDVLAIFVSDRRCEFW